MTRRNDLGGLAGWMLVTFAAGALGAIASVQARTFYGLLTRPEWAPPATLFGPVWTGLYLLMGISAWLVWRTGGWLKARRALVTYLVQLVANALWSWLFFAWHLGAAASVEVGVLWLLIVITAVQFWRQHRGAALLLLPYLAWVSFAAVLCYTVWQLNPDKL